MELKATLYLGNKGKKGHSKVDLKLEQNTKGWCFSASGLHDYQYNRSCRDWDYQGGGQCLDSILHDHSRNKELQEIVRLWKLYHLNDLNAGTPRQTEYLESLGKYIDYDWACDELTKAGLYADAEFSPNNPYKYGSAWLYREIPANDLTAIKNLITKISAKAKN